MHVQTEFLGSGQNNSELYLTANAEISFATKCQAILRFNSVELKEKKAEEQPEDAEYYYEEEIDPHPNSEKLAEDIENYELKFAFHDGVISEVCPDEVESTWVLNFKKGLLSALQNSMQRFDVDYNTTETDISGKCDVVYTLIGSADTSLAILKTKDLTTCKNRYKTDSILQTTHYEFREVRTRQSM